MEPRLNADFECSYQIDAPSSASVETEGEFSVKIC